LRIDQRRFDNLRLLRQAQAITDVAQLDPTGKEQLRVSRFAGDLTEHPDYSHDPKFTEAVAKKFYNGPMYLRRQSEPFMTLAVAGSRRDAGVTVVEVGLKLVWDVVSQRLVGERRQAYVIDTQGRLIAHTDISLVLRNTDMTQLAQVRAARTDGAGAVGEAKDIQGRDVLSAYARVAPLGWLVFVEMPIEEAK
jgi:two-component system, NtrC family, sensor kinase